MIEAKLQQALASFPDAKTIYITYSGGLDSTALLLSAVRSLQTLKPTQSFCAIHVHHGLSSHADAWAEHCQAVCAEYQIPCIVERVQLDLKGKSLEQAAREARYAVFKRHVGTDDILLLAHHLDDQIETVLMRLIRETDSSLLAAIPHSRPMGLGHLVRPFLDLRRKDLEQYVQDQGVSWVEDASNQDLSITRNRIRHQVLPRLLAQSDSYVDDLVLLSKGHTRVNGSALRLAQAVLKHMHITNYANDHGISLTNLNLLAKREQTFLLRWWFISLGLAQPSERIFSRIWTEVLPAKSGSTPELMWGSIRLVRCFDALFIMDESSHSLNLQCGDDQSEIDFDLLNDQTIELRLWDEQSKRDRFGGRRKSEWAKRLFLTPWRKESAVFVFKEGQELGIFDVKRKVFIAKF